MDSIFVENVRLLGKHGVHEHERKSEQEFVISIHASFDTRTAGQSDELVDTLNYTHLAAIAKEVVENNSFQLIERLAEIICSEILQDGRIQKVATTVRKPAALQNGLPGVTIVRAQI